MGSTALFKYRYPESTDPPDGPLGYRNLAEDVELSVANLAGAAVIGATSSIVIPANTDYGVGPVSVTSSVPGLVTARQDGIIFTKPGFLIAQILYYYAAGGLQWQFWQYHEGPNIFGTYSGAPIRDRVSMSLIRQLGNSNDQTIYFMQRCSGSSNVSTTFNLSGLYFPKNV